MLLASAIACDALARKGGRSGGRGGWTSKGQGWHGGHQHHRGHVFIGAGFYNPWYAWYPWDSWHWYPPLSYYYSSIETPVYFEQYAAPLQSGFWYYCHSAGTYYPGVAECPEGWEPVAPAEPR